MESPSQISRYRPASILAASAGLKEDADDPSRVTQHLEELISAIRVGGETKGKTLLRDETLVTVIESLTAVLSSENTRYFSASPSWDSVRSSVDIVLSILSYLFQQKTKEFPDASRALGQLKMILETRKQAASAVS